MNDIRVLRHKVRDEAKAFKKDAKNSLSASDMRKLISMEKRFAERTYKQDQKILINRVKAETDAFKILSRC